MNDPPRNIHIVGVPMDLGAGRRGVDMGPSAIRLAGLEPCLETQLQHRIVTDRNLLVPVPEQRDPGTGPRYLREIARTCRHLTQAVERILDDGGFPLVLGGDHSIAIGTVAGIAGHYRARQQKIGLLWFDAHGDMNTPESSPSQNIHGMPLAVILGMGAPELVNLGGFAPKVDPRHVAIVGLRNIDRRERELIASSGVHAYTMRDIDDRGMAACVREALEFVQDGTAGFHVSFDMDGLDPAIAPGVGTPVRGGVEFREGHLLMEMVADTGRMLGLEVTELNPILDTKNATGELAVDLIQSALGKRIL